MIYLINKIRAELKLLEEKRRGYDNTFDSVIHKSYWTPEGYQPTGKE